MKRKTSINMNTKPFARVTKVGYVTRHLFPLWTRLLIWSMQLPRVPFMKMVSRLLRIWRTNGPKFLVLYTKEALRIVQHFVAGTPVFLSEGVPVGLVGGLPSIIPGPLRRDIRLRDPKVIRGILSILSIYRIIKCPGELKLSTITDPFKGMQPTLSRLEIGQALSELHALKSWAFQPFRLVFSGSAGPNSSRAVTGIWKDLDAWRNNPDLFQKLKEFISLFPGGPEFLTLIEGELELLPPAKVRTYLGRLSLKEEAAGKVRVFAITDILTQSAMAPIHQVIFRILSKLPQDGTFNQVLPVNSLKQKLIDGQVSGNIYSYDLSAATDRLPLLLQQQVLEVLVGSSRFADLWGSLMRDRDWSLISPDKSVSNYRYAVGQPMGALSSWAMLALTHHVLVRIAANRVGEKNFSNYAILGDDIVIANELVAKSYHWLMTKWLGVDINLSKSLVSEHTFEYAKRLVSKDGEFTPVGPKNLLLGLKSINGIPSIFLDLYQKGFSLPEPLVDTMMSDPPFLRGSQAKALLYLIKGPFGFIPTAGGVASSMKNVTALTTVRVDSLLSSIAEAKHRLDVQEWEFVVKRQVNNLVLFRLYSELDGIEYNIQSGPVHAYILNRLSSEFKECIFGKPVRRFFFGGPLVMFNYTRPTYGEEIVSHIRSLLHTEDYMFVHPFDLFREEFVLLPFKSATHRMDSFIRLVKQIELEKDQARREAMENDD